MRLKRVIVLVLVLALAALLCHTFLCRDTDCALCPLVRAAFVCLMLCVLPFGGACGADGRKSGRQELSCPLRQSLFLRRVLLLC